MVGFFDSGIGGLSVLECALSLPQSRALEYVYFADSDNAPYGLKSKDEIIALSQQGVEFLLDCGARAIVFACNTATSAAISTLRKRFDIPLIGMEPAIKPALSVAKVSGKDTLLLATPATLAGDKLSSLLGELSFSPSSLKKIALPKLVEFAQNGEFKSANVERYLQSMLGEFKGAGQVVLGCTHFNYFKDSILKVLGSQIKFFDGNMGTLKQLFKNLPLSELENNQSHQKQDFSFYVSKRRVDSASLKGHLARLAKMREI